MNEDEIKHNIARNISFYRRRNGLTQAELAELINYSDKSISKWERGEGLPDICVLFCLAQLFGITVNELISSESEEKQSSSSMYQHILIPLMAMGLVWLVASLVFFVFELFVKSFEQSWLIIIWAIPPSCIVSIIFAELWWPLVPRLISASAFIWSLSVCSLLTFNMGKIYPIFVVAAVLQILVLLWYIYIGKKRHRKPL